ncbi:hypothetical protein QEN19_004436 [Hanseniaspora menglaensis]
MSLDKDQVKAATAEDDNGGQTNNGSTKLSDYLKKMVSLLFNNQQDEEMSDDLMQLIVFMNIFLLFAITIPYMCIKFYVVNNKILGDNEFIDEIFHIKQSKHYLNMNSIIKIFNPKTFKDNYDPKLTTPPGLYFLQYFWNKLLVAPISWLNFTKYKFRAVTTLRIINLICGTIIMPLYTYSNLCSMSVICFTIPGLVMFPVLSTYYNIYYTEVWSTFWLLTGLMFAVLPHDEQLPEEKETLHEILKLKKKYIWYSSFCCFISLLFRQTNIIWTILIMTITVERHAIIEFDLNDLWYNNYLKFILTGLNHFETLVLPFATNFVFFLLFLITNKSIALGDQSNHKFSLHIMQIFYCFSFITFFSFPLWFNQEFIIKYFIKTFGDIIKVIVTLLYYLLIAFSIRFFTIEHPFLLSDNRHLSFYIFKKIIFRNFFTKYFVALPFYHFAWYTVNDLLFESLLHFPDTLSPLKIHKSFELPLMLTHISKFVYYICLLLTLVPTPLFEPRYYIIPYLVWRIFVMPKHGNIAAVLLKEFIWLFIIDIAVFGLFCKIEIWSWTELDFAQRIIW